MLLGMTRLSTQLPANAYPGRQQLMTQQVKVLESLAPTQDIQIKFLVSDFDLAQPKAPGE